MELDTIISDIKKGKIKEIQLKKLPLLKTVTNWQEVEYLGWVDYQMKYSYYDGAIVKADNKLFYVQEKTVSALQAFITWNSGKKIQVVAD